VGNACEHWAIFRARPTGPLIYGQRKEAVALLTPRESRRPSAIAIPDYGLSAH
jgi:hypothetical protein